MIGHWGNTLGWLFKCVPKQDRASFKNPIGKKECSCLIYPFFLLFRIWSGLPKKLQNGMVPGKKRG